jgi:hypothetical protein
LRPLVAAAVAAGDVDPDALRFLDEVITAHRAGALVITLVVDGRRDTVVPGTSPN